MIYESGLKNLFKLYIPITDYLMLIDNSGEPYQMVAEGIKENAEIINREIWKSIIKKYDENE